MSNKTWVILGATSIIAEEFAQLIAQAKQNLILVGRNFKQLEIIAANIHLRYGLKCTLLCIDFASDITKLLEILQNDPQELNLFIAHSLMLRNAHLDNKSIADLINTNILSTVQIVHAYLQRPQTTFHVVFLSSVAASRGRSKNSLYGGSKAAVEIYLEGLQQSAKTDVHITIVRLGFIDTVQTYGEGVFYASPPKVCAKACWEAVQAKKRLIYHPLFWRPMMALIKWIPYFIYRKLKF
jgi:short-subunit dehydrogenase